MNIFRKTPLFIFVLFIFACSSKQAIKPEIKEPPHLSVQHSLIGEWTYDNGRINMVFDSDSVYHTYKNYGGGRDTSRVYDGKFYYTHTDTLTIHYYDRYVDNHWVNEEPMSWVLRFENDSTVFFIGADEGEINYQREMLYKKVK